MNELKVLLAQSEELVVIHKTITRITPLPASKLRDAILTDLRSMTDGQLTSVTVLQDKLTKAEANVSELVTKNNQLLEEVTQLKELLRALRNAKNPRSCDPDSLFDVIKDRLFP